MNIGQVAAQDDIEFDFSGAPSTLNVWIFEGTRPGRVASGRKRLITMGIFHMSLCAGSSFGKRKFRMAVFVSSQKLETAKRMVWSSQ